MSGASREPAWRPGIGRAVAGCGAVGEGGWAGPVWCACLWSLLVSKARTLFEKNSAPILHLSGMDVTVVKSKEDFTNICIEPDTVSKGDFITIGDWTLLLLQLRLHGCVIIDSSVGSRMAFINLCCSCL
ncbi:hypothetical protein ACRRTK_015889 [Alexandromys fortis]